MAKETKATPAVVDLSEVETMSASEVAEELGVDPKSFRAWHRRKHGTLPKGMRYAFRKADLEKIRKAFGERRGGTVLIEYPEDEAAEG